MYKSIDELQDSDNLWEELYEMARQALIEGDVDNCPIGIKRLSAFVEMDMKVYNAGLQGYFSQRSSEGRLDEVFTCLCDSLRELGAIGTVQLLCDARTIWDREYSPTGGKESWDHIVDLISPFNSRYYYDSEDRGEEIELYARKNPDQFVYSSLDESEN